MPSRALTYDDFRRTGAQDCHNAIDISGFEASPGESVAQVVDRTWKMWEDEDDLEARWLAQQDDFEGLDPRRAYQAWRDGWKECAVELLAEHHRVARSNPGRGAALANIERLLERSPAIRGGIGGDARMAIVSGEMSEPKHGRLRVTFFGPDGPHGHVTRDARIEIADEIRSSFGRREPIAAMTDDEVIAWTSTEEFKKGSKLTAYVQAENALRWRAGQVGRLEWAFGVVTRANDVGTRHGAVNNRGKPYDSEALDEAIAMISAALRELPERNPPRSLAGKPVPRRDQPCYRTKTEMIKKFLDVNSEIVQGYGGAAYAVSPSEFDAINHKYGLTGKKAVRTIADAVWVAMPVGKPYCLDRLDLDALNDTRPAREAGMPFILPDVVYESALAKQYAQHYAEVPEPSWVTDIDPEDELPVLPSPESFKPYHLELEERGPGVETYRFGEPPIPQVVRPRPEIASPPPPASPPVLAARPVTARLPTRRATTAPVISPPRTLKPYRLELEDEEPGVAHYRIANPAGGRLEHYKYLASLAQRWSQGPFHAPPDLRKYTKRVPKEDPRGDSGTFGLVDRDFWLGELLGDIRRDAADELNREDLADFDRYIDDMITPASANPPPKWSRGLDMDESRRLAESLRVSQDELDRKERLIESTRRARLPLVSVEARTGTDPRSTTPRGVYIRVSSPGIAYSSVHAVADVLVAAGERVRAREPRYVLVDAGPDLEATAARVADVLRRNHYRISEPEHASSAPTENPAWVTNILSRHFVYLEEHIPPQWLPKLTKTAGRHGKITAALQEYGCGAYGCVLPTLDPKVVLKLTTDETEAQFANELADILSSPIVVKYHLVRQLPDRHNGRPTFMLWRDAADRVGEVLDVASERSGRDFAAASNAINDQHEAAGHAFLALHEGRPADRLIAKWETKARAMGKIPELRELADGLIDNLHTSKVFMGDVHAGNIGLVNGRWVVVDPGHVAVLED